MDVTGGDLTWISGFLALIVPVTTAVSKGFEIWLASVKQKHEIERARAEQNHNITTAYLDRALKPEEPLEYRDALLRFLATDATDSQRLRVWATEELRRVGQKIGEIRKAQTAVYEAKDDASIKAAVDNLRLVQEQQALLAPPNDVPITPAAIRAGYFVNDKTKRLVGLKMVQEDLRGARLLYCDLKNADFSGADLRGANFQGADLRMATLANADIDEGNFFDADCRGADFTGARLKGCKFERTHLEKAKLSGADLTGANLRARYDAETVWPDGLDLTGHDAVKVD